jgi:hypothetical protein
MNLFAIAQARLPVSLSATAVRPIALVAVLFLAITATIVLLRVGDQRLSSTHDAAIRRAWQDATKPTNGALTAQAVRGRFNITGGPGGDLTWQVASANELRASLLAADATAIRLREVKITRRGAGFTVSAEQAQ